MDKIEEFVDERQKSWCVQCGAWIAEVETNEDHVPSRTFLRKPHPAHLPTVRICVTCNNSFSADEEYLSLFLQCVLAGTTDPDRHPDPKVGRALRRHEKLRTRIERSRTEDRTLGGETRHVWKPEIDRIYRVILKNARGHAFHEYGEPMLTEPQHTWAAPLEAMTPSQCKEFEKVGAVGEPAGWPEVGSRMMTRLLTGQDLCEGWIIVQEGVYRYSVTQPGGILVRSVLFEYLATEVFWSDH